jgi:hypothetical protein
MVAVPAPRVQQHQGTPLYLGLVRAGAALSVGAFATVLAISVFDSEGQQSADSDAGGAREIMLTEAAVDDSSAYDAGSENAGKSPAETMATATPAPQLAPSSAGGVSGAGASPTIPPSPVPPATGVDANADATPSDNTQRSTTTDTFAATPAGGGVAIEPGPGGPGVTSFEPLSTSDGDDDGLALWTIALGALAAISLGALALLEVSRRRNLEH